MTDANSLVLFWLPLLGDLLDHDPQRANHVGHPAELIDVTTSLLDWAQASGLTWDGSESPAGEVWGCRLEMLLTDPDEQPDKNLWETRLAFRLAD